MRLFNNDSFTIKYEIAKARTMSIRFCDKREYCTATNENNMDSSKGSTIVYRLHTNVCSQHRKEILNLTETEEKQRTLSALYVFISYKSFKESTES